LPVQLEDTFTQGILPMDPAVPDNNLVVVVAFLSRSTSSRPSHKVKLNCFRS
jgi:hypothetical protein